MLFPSPGPALCKLGLARSAVFSTWSLHSGPRTFLVFLATAILDSFSLFYLPNTMTKEKWPKTVASLSRSGRGKGVSDGLSSPQGSAGSHVLSTTFANTAPTMISSLISLSPLFHNVHQVCCWAQARSAHTTTGQLSKRQGVEARNMAFESQLTKRMAN